MSMNTPLLRARAQALAWVKGESRHDDENNECTPDFSCCMPECFVKSKEERVEIFNTWARRNGFPAYADD